MLIYSLAAESSLHRWGGIGAALRLMRGNGESPLRLVEIMPALSDCIGDSEISTVAAEGLGSGANPVYSTVDRSGIRLANVRRTAKKLLKRFGEPDAIIVHNEELVISGRQLGDFLDKPTIYVSHSDLSIEHPSLQDAYEAQRSAVENASRIIAFSPSHVNWLKQRWGVPATLVFLPLGQLGPSSTNPIPQLDRPRIISAGRAVYHKGFDLLFDTFCGLYADFDAKIAVGNGSPEIERELRCRAEGFSNIEIVKWRDSNQMPAFIESSNLVVIPSRFEPLGLFCAEAIMHRRPVVMTDVVGIASLLDDTDCVAPSDDHAKFAELIEIGLSGGLDVTPAAERLSEYTYDLFLDCLNSCLTT